MYSSHGFQSFDCSILFRRNGQYQTGNIDILFRNAHCHCPFENAFGDGKAVICLFRDAVFVQCPPNDGDEGAVRVLVTQQKRD